MAVAGDDFGTWPIAGAYSKQTLLGWCFSDNVTGGQIAYEANTSKRRHRALEAQGELSRKHTYMVTYLQLHGLTPKKNRSSTEVSLQPISRIINEGNGNNFPGLRPHIKY